jgi:5'(3')-deoxyribonucleotidase
MNKILLTDIDDVVLDWTAGFKHFVELKLGRTITGKPTTPTMEEWLGLTYPEIRKLIDEFDRNNEDFGNLKSMRLSEIYLNKLKNDGYDIVAITASSTKPESMKRRKDNLLKEIGDIFTYIHFVNRSEEKREYLKLYKPTFFIEDKIANGLMAIEEGHKGIIMCQSTNGAHENCYKNLTWVNNWKEVYNLIITS